MLDIVNVLILVKILNHIFLWEPFRVVKVWTTLTDDALYNTSHADHYAEGNDSNGGEYGI